MIIKDQHLDEERYLDFARRWVVLTSRVELRAPARLPEIELVGNVNEKDREESIRNGAVYWHTEHAYEANPVNMLLFYARKVPRVGGRRGSRTCAPPTRTWMRIRKAASTG